MKVPVSCNSYYEKELAWRCCHGILPLRPQLSIRGMDIDPLCPVCHEENETALHCLFHCREARHTWFGSTLSLCLDDVHSVPDFTADFLLHTNAETAGHMITILYCLWEKRNKMVYQGTPFTWTQVLARTTSLISAPTEHPAHPSTP